jgi:hypothetical protein
LKSSWLSVGVAGVWRYVYRAVDQYGQVIDVFVSMRRNVAAAIIVYVSRQRSMNSSQRSDRKADATPVCRGPRSTNATVPFSPTFFTSSDIGFSVSSRVSRVREV